MDDYCTVTFTGDQGGTYYLPCTLVEYVSTNGMVNTGSSTINLYTSPNQSNNTAAITIPAFSYPRYSTGYGNTYITNASNISFNNRSYYYRDRGIVEIVLLTLLACLLFIRTIVGGRR